MQAQTLDGYTTNVHMFQHWSETLYYYILDLTHCIKFYALSHSTSTLSRCMYAIHPNQETGLLTNEIGVVVLPGPQAST